MRKIYTCTLIAVFALAACDQPADTPLEKEKPAYHTEYQQVGVIHNEILDFLYDRLTEKTGRFASIQEYKRFLKGQTVNWLAAHQQDAALERYQHLPVDLSGSGSFLNPNSNSGNRRMALSPQFRQLVKQAHSIIPESRLLNNPDDRKKRFTELRETALRELTKQESILFTMTTSTLEHSADYWMDDANSEKWIATLTSRLPVNALSDSDPVTQDRISASANPCYWNPLCLLIDWKEVAIEDGGGVLSAAVALGFKWIVASTPPGAASIAIAVAGGAVGASASEIYNQLTDYL